MGRTFSNALDAAHAICGYIRCSSPPQGVTEAEKMWHFKTQGFRSIRSLRSANVSVVVSSANTNGLNSTTMHCRGNMSSYVSVHQPNDPSQPEPCGLLAQGNKRKRVSASSKRKQQQCEQARLPHRQSSKILNNLHMISPYSVETKTCQQLLLRQNAVVHRNNHRAPH